MATLKHSLQRMLPAPVSPTRLKPVDTDAALRQLGFDASFDVLLQCKVDGICAMEDLAQTCSCGEAFQNGDVVCRRCCVERSQVQRVRRLHFVLARLEAGRRRLSLPCACVHLSKALKNEDDAKPSAAKSPTNAKSTKRGSVSAEEGEKKEEPKKLSPEDPRHELVEKVAAAAGVDMGSVLVDFIGKRLQCSVQVSRPGVSLLGMRDALAAAVKDKGGGMEKGDKTGIHRAFAECGTTEDLGMAISVSWAKERVIEEANLVHPGYVLEDAKLNGIMEAAAQAREAYEAAWKEIVCDEKDAAAVLLTYAPLATFVGAGSPKLLPVADGVADGLIEELPKQALSRLQALVAAAAEAHLQLKRTLAPNTTWAQEAMHDLSEIPYDHECRTLTTAKSSNHWDGPVTGATLIDLGLKAERRIFEKAKWLQRPEQTTPPLADVLDISHILISFENCADLCDGLERLTQSLDVVSLDNRFSNPSCVGHRCIILIVRQDIEIEVQGMYRTSSHISKLILEHKDMFHVKERAGAAHLKQIRSLLSAIGVSSRELANLQRILMRELGCTKAQAVQAQERELHSALACAADASAQTQKGLADGPALAQRIMDEAIQQALAAGVPQMRVVAATARANAGSGV